MNAIQENNIKFTYFNLRARGGEVCRLILAYAAEEYEDNRIELEKWSNVNPTLNLPFGQLPTLEVHGNVLCQSVTIGRYLAKRYDLIGKSVMESTKADMVIDCCADMITVIVSAFFLTGKEKEQKMKEIKYEGVPEFIANLEKVFENNDGKYII